MTRSYALVRSVLGATRGSILAFAEAIDCLILHSFRIGRPIEDVPITDIYAEVADMLYRPCRITQKQIERTSHRCWDVGDREKLDQIIGKHLEIRPTPREMLIYFAAYSHYGKPYHEVLGDQLAEMF